MMHSFWLQGTQAGAKNTFDCITAFSKTDFTEDLKQFDVTTISSDRSVPQRSTLQSRSGTRR